MKKLALSAVILLLSLVGSAQSAEYTTGIPHDKKELTCLTTMVYHESRGEGRKGMLAVAYVAINRAGKNTDRWGRTICEVVRKPYQFEGMLHANKIVKEKEVWEEAEEISTLAFYGLLKDPTKGAVYFHANYIQPSWAYVKTKTLQLGNHIFYAEK